jgi:hypothetical protein
MIVEKAIWTTLPHGLDDAKRLRVSVHVAPRLTTDDDDPSPRKLGEFPVFEAWPDRAANMRWRVEFDNGVVAEGVPVDQPDPDLWQRLFPPETFVRPHAFKDHAKRSLHVFPVRDVLQFVQGTYANLAAAGPDLPSIDGPNPLTTAFGPLKGLTDQITDSSSFRDEVYRAQDHPKDDRDRPDGKVVVESVSGTSGAANSLFQAYRFYFRPGDQRPEFDPAFKPDHIEPPPDPPNLDFHDLVTLLADHPRLLRRLGLVVDLTVQLEDPHGQLPAAGAVRVVPEGDVPEAPPRAPWTRYDLEDGWFGARPKQSFLLEHGLVRLTREFWDLFQVDVDGAALQSVGFGDTLARLTDPSMRNHETPDATGAPALRSGGFSLSRQGRGQTLLGDLKGRRDLNAQIEHGVTVEFDAEDLIRGYRVDVFDEHAPGGKRWFSLHDRFTTHFIGEPGAGEPEALDPIRDEGYVKSTSASSERQDHPNPSDDLYLHETVVSWDGWSLAAARPGKRVVEPGEGEDGGASPLARHDPKEGQLRPLVSVTEVAPKSLPRLRVGHVYRLRIRTVDLAGNSVDFTPDELAPPESELSSESQLAVRFEPVPSPTVLRRHLDTEGESLEHLVIRSDGGVTAKDYADSPAVKQALADSNAKHAYAQDSQRHLAAPKGSMQMAEFDGLFDQAMGGTAAQMTAALRTALREEGTFLDPKIIDTATGKPTIAQSTISLHPAGTTLPVVRGTGLSGSESDFDKKAAGAYAFYPDADVLLPYLPDPMAIGIAIVGYDHTGAEVLSLIQPFSGSWPDLAPFRIRLSEAVAPAVPGIEFTGGVLEVRLPKAEVIRAKLSSVFPGDRLDDFAIWDWTPEPARTAALKQGAVDGRHWMLTPHRWLTLTHAVQHPLATPDTSLLTVTRQLGQTFATFHGPIKNHAKSTGRLDVFGNWCEDVDLITDKAPRYARTGTAVPHAAQAFGLDLGPGEDDAQVAVGPDGKSRASRHEFGDTKYRRVVYHGVATTRFREYLPRPIADDPDAIQRRETWTNEAGDWLAPLVRDVPSSARPATPDVVQTLPTFRWERDDSGSTRTHVRHGKAVRVWLRRPWFSSGDGEQLGVVLEPSLRLPPGWATPLDMIDQVALGSTHLAKAKKSAGSQIAKAKLAAMTTVTAADAGGETVIAAKKASSLSAVKDLVGGVGLGPVVGPVHQPPTAAEIHGMLQPYVTRWGSDPVWASRLPELPPMPSDFTSRISTQAGLTLEEVAPQAKVTVVGHEVFYDEDRELWYADIEIDNGDSYFPFVRLALARFQPHSVEGAHLSRISMTDFMQLAPDRTAEVVFGRGFAGVTVRGYGGENTLARTLDPFIATLLPDFEVPRPNTTMRAVLEHRPKGIPGDLGWERIGSEVTLKASTNGFHVTWVGNVALPDADDGLDRRILITESETFQRDPTRSEAAKARKIRNLDLVRERVVYADVFEL